MKNFAIAGYLGTAPTLKSKGETVWTDLRVAVNGTKDHTDWFWITAFGPLAEAICKSLVKGSGIAIQGELRTQEWDGAERTKLIAKQATFFGKTKPKAPNASAQPADAQTGDDQDDDIPF